MAAAGGIAVWAGRVISILVSLVFVMGAVMQFRGGAEVAEGMTKMGLPQSLGLPLAILQLSCAVLYLIPTTSILGTILLTGYLGGAVLTHLRVGDQLFLVPIAFGILVWLGLWLREPRLRGLLPLRRRVRFVGGGST